MAEKKQGKPGQERQRDFVGGMRLWQRQHLWQDLRGKGRMGNRKKAERMGL